MEFRQTGSIQIQGGGEVPYVFYRLFPKRKKSKLCTKCGNFRKSDSPLSGVNDHQRHLQKKGKRQVNIAQTSQKVNAEYREGPSSVVVQEHYLIKLLEKCYTLFKDFSYLSLCLFGRWDPLITSWNSGQHPPSHNCFTTSAQTP